MVQPMKPYGMSVVAEFLQDPRRVALDFAGAEEGRVCAILVEKRNRLLPIGKVPIVERKDKRPHASIALRLDSKQVGCRGKDRA